MWNLGNAGYTFNAAELSVKKDPSERYRLGYGVVVTAGEDSQKNHSLGVFRDSDDRFPFRNTPKYDLPEATTGGRGRPADRAGLRERSR